jgi:hypothetical protein
MGSDKTNRGGRTPQYPELGAMTHMKVRVPEAYKEKIREIGGDNLSAGTRYLFEFWQEHSPNANQDTEPTDD